LLNRGLDGGRYRSRTYDLVRVKLTSVRPRVDRRGIPYEFWTSRDWRGPLTLRNRHQTATKKLPRSLQSFTKVPRRSRPIGRGILPHALDQPRLSRRDVKEHQRRPLWRSAIRLVAGFGAPMVSDSARRRHSAISGGPTQARQPKAYCHARANAHRFAAESRPRVLTTGPVMVGSSRSAKEPHITDSRRTKWLRQQRPRKPAGHLYDIEPARHGTRMNVIDVRDFYADLRKRR